jgi:ATP-dependent DNA helicase HFM1/MER3
MGSNLSTLESCLHQSLSEHLNSEIVLGAITNLETAREWLRNSFLFKRIQLNPSHYGVTKTAEWQTWEAYFDAIVTEALASLKSNKLMTDEVNGRMSATEFGVIASRAYVKQSSMSLIIELPETSTKKELVSSNGPNVSLLSSVNSFWQYLRPPSWCRCC